MDIHTGDTAISIDVSHCNSSSWAPIPDELEEISEESLIFDENTPLNKISNISDQIPSNKYQTDYAASSFNTLDRMANNDYMSGKLTYQSYQNMKEVGYNSENVISSGGSKHFPQSPVGRIPLAPITNFYNQARRELKEDEQSLSVTKFSVEDFVNKPYTITLKIDMNEESGRNTKGFAQDNGKMLAFLFCNPFYLFKCAIFSNLRTIKLNLMTLSTVYVTNTENGTIKRLVFNSSERKRDDFRSSQFYQTISSIQTDNSSKFNTLRVAAQDFINSARVQQRGKILILENFVLHKFLTCEEPP